MDDFKMRVLKLTGRKGEPKYRVVLNGRILLPAVGTKRLANMLIESFTLGHLYKALPNNRGRK